MIRRHTLGIAATALALAVAGGGTAAGQTRDMSWFLRQTADLDRLPYLEQGVVSRQFSSYNRASHYDRRTKKCVAMDTNGDAGYCLKVHFGPTAAAEFHQFEVPAGTPRLAFGDLQWVLDPVERTDVFFFPRPGVAEPQTVPPENVVACIAGPGYIDRIWSANPMGKVRFYFDGSTQPMEFDFKDLFTGGAGDPDQAALARRRQWPFLRPMTFRREGEGDAKASDCYLPIPFAKSCVITLTKPAYYHFGYKTFAPDVKVKTFRLPLTAEEDAVLGEVCDKFLHRGSDPKPVRPGTESIEKTVELPPGEEVVLAELSGPGVIQALHAKLRGKERYAHSKVLLTGRFDDESRPSIWSPLVNFFGTGFQPHDYKSYPLGYIDGEGYCYFPMPFRRRARLAVKNEGTQPATLSYRIVHAPLDDPPAGLMHFKCKYRREEVCSTFDYPFLECQGRGRFVGAALAVDDAWRSWWGEGDEKIWVDDDVFPSFFGTGSEDFFGDAWGIRTLQETFFACSFLDHNRDHAWTCCYRWMVPDDVPFQKRFRATIENYPETIFGTRAVKWDEDYTSTAYWYQVPGGSDFFQPVPVQRRRPWGKVPAPPLVEAEDVLSAQLDQGAKILNDERLDYEFSHGKVLDLGIQQAGDEVSFQGPDLILEGPYTIKVHTPRKVPRPAAFELFSQGRKLGQTPADYGRSDVSNVAFGVLPRGRSEFTIRFTSPGRAVFDCFQFGPARQLHDVVEAEQLRVIDSSGQEPTRPIGVLFSGGRQLQWPAARVGDTLEVEVNVPAGRWNLCGGLVRGPGQGNYQATVGEQPPLVLEGFAPTQRVVDWVRLGKCTGPNGKTRIRFQCLGKNPQSSGFGLGLDYVGWQRIVVEDAIEGETAKLADVHHGHFVPQRLGPRFSGQSHLWFHPDKPGASFAWLLDAPQDGDYAVAVYFTKSWDYAVVRLSLDGKPLGEFDTYAPTVQWAGRQPLGVFPLKKGQHRLVFEVVGHNEKSRGILVGVDCLTLKKQSPGKAAESGEK